MLTSSSQICAEKTPLAEAAKTAVQPERPLMADAYSALSAKECQTYLVGSGERSSVYDLVRSWLTKVPGLVVGISKKRLKRSRERAGSSESELLLVELLGGVQYLGHSAGEHFVRLVAGSLVVGAADVDARVVEGAAVVTAPEEIGNEVLRAVLAAVEAVAVSCRLTKLPGLVGIENANVERRSKDKLAREPKF